MIRMRRLSARRRRAAGAGRAWPGRRSRRGAVTRSPTSSRRRGRRSPSTWRRRRSARAAGRSPPGSCPRMSGRGPFTGRSPCARAANLVSGHHIPVYRATLVLCQFAGIAVSTGWMAGIRGKAAAMVEASGFTGRVRELLKTAPAVHADETPARAAGGTRYLHLACTRHLTCMHTGDRSAAAIDADGVLPGYEGVIVRDGYAGYSHLTSALHAWCAVHYADLGIMTPRGWMALLAGAAGLARSA